MQSDINEGIRRTGQDLDRGTQPGLAFLAGKIARHWRWIRDEGLAKVVEEDQLNPVPRATQAWRKRRWRARHGVAPGQARPVYLVGAQRSGTNMLLRGIEQAPEVEVRGENDAAVFDRYRIRDHATVRHVVGASRHRIVLLKPLCDSHDVLDMLGWDDVGPRPRAIWAFRDVDGRARSTMAKFGDHDRAVMRAIAEGRGDALWQRRGVDDEMVSFLQTFDYDTMTPATGAALFWLVRNRLVLDLGLAARPDVAVVSYNRFVEAPEQQMQALCGFLDLPYRPEMAAHMDRRSASTHEPLPIDERVRRRCDELDAALLAAALEPSTHQ